MSLIIKNLNKKFSEKTIFCDFSYEFDDTGVYVISGRSGIGKTTLLRIIAGLDTDYSGEVIGGGIENVSFCFQEYRLFPTVNAIENVTLVSFDIASEGDILHAERTLLELGLDKTELTLYPSELSGGMKQRVALARAFLKDSKILLLDEPTKELNEKIADKVRELILKEAKRRLVIIVTHETDEPQRLGAKTINISDAE